MSSPAWQTPTPLRRLAADTIVWELIECCSPENWPFEIKTNYVSQNNDYFMNDYFVNNGYDEEEDESEEELGPDDNINNDNVVPFNIVNNENAEHNNHLNNYDVLLDVIPQEVNEDVPGNANHIDENPVAENDIPENVINEPMQDDNDNGLAEVENIPNPHEEAFNIEDFFGVHVNDHLLGARVNDYNFANIKRNNENQEGMDVDDEDQQSESSSTGGNKLDLDLVLLASRHGKINYRGKKYTNREDLNRHLKTKIWVLKKIKRLKNWWDSTDILGPLHSSLQLQVRKGFYENLQYCDDLPHLYKFLLQVLFASETGLCLPTDIFTNDKRQLKRVCLSTVSCKEFANVVRSLGPFTLEHLVINTIKFINISPLLAIFSNAPFLKTIDIIDCPEVDVFEDSWKCSPQILKCISKCCPILELLEIDYAGIITVLPKEEDYIYEYFFNGMKKVEVLESVRYIESVSIPFPCLKKIKLKRIPIDFLGNLSYVYTELQNLDFIFGHKNFPNNPCFLKNVQLTSEVLSCLTIEWAKKIHYVFPKMRHLTIYHECVNVSKLTLNAIEMGNNLSTIINDGEITSVSLKFDYSYQFEDIYSDLTPYFPTFEKIGPSLTTFIYINSLCDVKSLAQIINECSNVLTIKVILPQRSVPFSAQTEDFELKPKPHLKSLTLLNDQDTYHDSSCRSEFNVVVRGFLKVTPNIETLEIDAREIRMVLYLIDELKDKRADGFYNHITSLTLVRDIKWFDRFQGIDFGFNGDGDGTKLSCWMIDNIKTLVESLPHLKKVIIYFPLWDFLYIRNLYQGTALRFIHGKMDLDHIKAGGNSYLQ